MRYRFSGFEVDPREGRLERDGVVVEVQPKVVDALAVFVARAGALVTRDELHASLWPDTHVTDDALPQIIRKLRRALGDDARESRFIETVPRRGYRFIAAVSAVEPSTTRPPPPPPADDDAPPPPPPADDDAPPPRPPADAPTTTTTAPGADRPAPTTTTPRADRTARWRWGVFATVLVATAIAVGVGDWRRHSTGGPLVRGTCASMRLTHSPEREQDGAFLGDRVVFVANDPDEGQYDLYITSRTGAGRMRLTHTPGDEFYPQVSPDGRTILHTRGDRDRLSLWELAPTGGSARLVAEDAAWGTYAPTGDELAYVRTGDRDAAIIVRDRRSGRERTVATIHGTVESLAWSPRGDRLAYVDGVRAWTVAVTGGTPRRASPDATYLRTVAWAGATLVSDGNFVGRGGLWWFRPGGELTPLTTNTGGQYHPAVDRRDVLFTAEAKQALVFVRDVGGTRRVPTTTAIDCLDVSPDGATLAFTDYDPASGSADREVVTQDLTGTRRDVLGPGACPRFSPDGTRVAYVRDQAAAPVLWVHPGGPFGPPGVAPVSQPAWTPDGHALVVATADALVRVEPDRVVAIAPGRFGRLDIAADGTIAANRAGAVVQIARDGTVQPLPIPASFDNRPQWTSEGLAVLRDERTRPHLVTYDPVGREVADAPLALAPDPGRWGVFEVVARGGRLIGIETRYESDLYLLAACVR